MFFGSCVFRFSEMKYLILKRTNLASMTRHLHSWWYPTTHPMREMFTIRILQSDNSINTMSFSFGIVGSRYDVEWLPGGLRTGDRAPRRWAKIQSDRVQIRAFQDQTCHFWKSERAAKKKTLQHFPSYRFRPIFFITFLHFLRGTLDPTTTYTRDEHPQRHTGWPAEWFLVCPAGQIPYF